MAPRIDGLETYQKVLEINRKQKAIIVSGFSETKRFWGGPEAGGRILRQETISHREDRRVHSG